MDVGDDGEEVVRRGGGVCGEGKGRGDAGRGLASVRPGSAGTAGYGGCSLKAAIWARVSTTEQETANQVRVLEEWAQKRGLEVVKVYQVEESAWQGKHLQALAQVYADARQGQFQCLLVWALDRLSREGPLATLEIVHRLGQSGVQVLSYQEQWTEAAGEMRDLLLAIAGWVARMESIRRSERTRAGLARDVAEGTRLGRPPGAKDRRKRGRSGYLLRWAKGGRRR